jgi:hypothetical protein
MVMKAVTGIVLRVPYLMAFLVEYRQEVRGSLIQLLCMITGEVHWNSLL